MVGKCLWLELFVVRGWRSKSSRGNGCDRLLVLLGLLDSAAAAAVAAAADDGGEKLGDKRVSSYDMGGTPFYAQGTLSVGLKTTVHESKRTAAPRSTYREQQQIRNRVDAVPMFGSDSQLRTDSVSKIDLPLYRRMTQNRYI